MYILIVVFVSILLYTLLRLYFPPKKVLVDNCYQYILSEREKYKHTYEFMPRNLEKRFYRNVRGITKYNRRQVAEAVIQKLIDNNVVELVPDLCVDRYRAIYVEHSRSSSTIVENESNT